MVGLVLLSATLQLAGDTVALSVTDALERALSQSRVVAAAELTAEAARYRASQSAAWGNPTLAVTAENLGAGERFTGLRGIEGVEGQALIGFSIPVGGDRGARIRQAGALGDAAGAGADATRSRVLQETVAALAWSIRDQGVVRTAREEVATLDLLAEALLLQAEAGRASRGDAARADLARGMAATRMARSEASYARSAEEAARLLGFAVGTRLDIVPDACGPMEAGGNPEPVNVDDLPEVRVADARVRAATATVDAARGARFPDLDPQIGLRRTGGESGLYVGLATRLPILNFGGRAVDAARSDESAALRVRDDQARRLAADRAAAVDALTALDRAGARFEATWWDNLGTAVGASEARYELGEGTLYELLDSRRARLDALADYLAWQADWWIARATVARLEGRPITAAILCNPNSGVES